MEYTISTQLALANLDPRFLQAYVYLEIQLVTLVACNILHAQSVNQAVHKQEFKQLPCLPNVLNSHRIAHEVNGNDFPFPADRSGVLGVLTSG